MSIRHRYLCQTCFDIGYVFVTDPEWIRTSSTDSVSTGDGETRICPDCHGKSPNWKHAREKRNGLWDEG